MNGRHAKPKAKHTESGLQSLTAFLGLVQWDKKIEMIGLV